MSNPAILLFTVALRHLSSDGKRADASLPPAQLFYVSPAQLKTLLESARALAPSVVPPTEPELRISSAKGEYIVRVKAGQLNLVSWSAAHKGGPASVETILSAVSGEQPETAQTAAAPRPRGGVREKLTMVLLALSIVGVNAFTIWFVTRPPRGFDAKYRLVSPERAQRVLAELAGTYETGRKPGDRRLEIRRDSVAHRAKYGAGATLKDSQTFTIQPAEANGATALVTNKKSIITVKDNISLVLYGDTYTRAAQ